MPVRRQSEPALQRLSIERVRRAWNCHLHPEHIESLEPYSGEWYPYIVAEADQQNWPGNGGWGVGLYTGGIVPKLQITSPKADPETAVAIQNKRGAPVSADVPGSTSDIAKRRNYKVRFRDWNGKRSVIQAHYIIGKKGIDYGHQIAPADKCQVTLHPHANLVELAGDQSGAGFQVDFKTWEQVAGGRCAGGACRMMGDYNTITGNGQQVSIPYVAVQGALQQLFLEREQ